MLNKQHANTSPDHYSEIDMFWQCSEMDLSKKTYLEEGVFVEHHYTHYKKVSNQFCTTTLYLKCTLKYLIYFLEENLF